MSLLKNVMLLGDPNESFWFPPQGSTFAEENDTFFMYLLWIATFFFVLIVAAMIIFVIKYRRRPGYKGDSKALHNNALEITWTVIPTLLVCWIFARGAYGYLIMMRPPAETIDINVTARKWDWTFQYPNGAIDDKLHIPINTPVQLRMRSEDVLHAMYIPAFRCKQDVVPGRVTTMWFEAILEDEFDLFCAEYCGDQHSEMIKQNGVIVHSMEDYEAYLAEAISPPKNPKAHGYWVYSRYGCKACHSVEEGKTIVGPSFANSFGSNIKNSKGEDIKFDAQYVRESLLEPQKHIRAGFEKASLMPSQQGKLDNEQINALTFFLEAMADPEFISAVADGDLSDDDMQRLGIADPEEGEEEEGAADTTDAASTGETESADATSDN